MVFSSGMMVKELTEQPQAAKVTKAGICSEGWGLGRRPGSEWKPSLGQNHRDKSTKMNPTCGRKPSKCLVFNEYTVKNKRVRLYERPDIRKT